ncbi:MAG TPA: oxygenase MpaB family protein, partial [Roseiarcus sp.]
MVSREDLERELRVIEALAPGQIEGVFGPTSLTWRVNREAAIFLGAGRALLLQLAHPWVAAAIAEHSRTLADPISRFHRTFNITFTLVFGTLDQALRAARHLHQRHSAIQGVLHTAVGPFAAGTHYRANDVAALRW